MKTFIIGHTKPDTDAVVAAMALEKLYSSEKCFKNSNPQAVIVDPLNPETTFLFEKFGIETPQLLTADQIQADDKVVLVDHNEESQRLTGLKAEQVVEIVDHHKVNLNLNSPVFLTFKPWGSSCSIVYFMMKQNNIQPDKTLASLMLAAILSDTVGFKSATSTPKDEELAKELAEIAQITDLDAFALEIFKAKSDVSQLSDKQIVTNDYKIMEFGGKKVLIDQLETVEQAKILTNKKAGLLTAMEEVKAEQNVDLIFVAISDILQVNTKLLILGDEEQQVAEKAFANQTQDQVLDIGPKLSRKKEIAPAIEQAIIAK
jgi:manganese-dependent inorganic pyrophosphatase